MGEDCNTTDASSVIKEEWKDELKLIENYIFDEITKKLDTYDIEDVVKSCVEKSDGIKEILRKLSVIEGMLISLSNQLSYSGTYTRSTGTWNPSIWSGSNISSQTDGSDQANLANLGDLLSCYKEDTKVGTDSLTKCGK